MQQLKVEKTSSALLVTLQPLGHVGCRLGEIKRESITSKSNTWWGRVFSLRRRVATDQLSLWWLQQFECRADKFVLLAITFLLLAVFSSTYLSIVVTFCAFSAQVLRYFTALLYIEHLLAFSFYSTLLNFNVHCPILPFISYNALVGFAFFVFVRHTAHCFLLLVSCMLYVVKKHCPEEVHLNRWAKRQQSQKK